MAVIDTGLLEKMFKSRAWKFFIDDLLELREHIRDEMEQYALGDPEGNKLRAGKLAMIQYIVDMWPNLIIEEIKAELLDRKVETKTEED